MIDAADADADADAFVIAYCYLFAFILILMFISFVELNFMRHLILIWLYIE